MLPSHIQSKRRDGRDRKMASNQGAYDRTAGQLIEQLSKCNGDIGAVL